MIFKTAAFSPLTYWWVGAILMWLTLPAGLFDILAAPKWHAPHWQCDSLGIPIMMTRRALLPAAGMALILSGTLVLGATWRREGGGRVFPPSRPRTWRGWMLACILLILSAVLCRDVLQYLYQITFVQTFVANCAGRAEPITVQMRRPPLQISPILYCALIFWMLNLHAFSASAAVPRR